jgi:methionine-rich copper-binding protein CopC
MGSENRQEFRWRSTTRSTATSAMAHNDVPRQFPGRNQTIKQIPAG